MRKDFVGRGWFVRNTLGRWLIAREAHAYELARRIEGLPLLYRRDGPFALLLEWIDGRPMAELERGDLTPLFFERLYALVARLHARGLAHGDLKSRRNILVTADQRPYVLDLASLVSRGRRWELFRNWLHEQLCLVDRNAIARLKHRLAPELLTDAERERLARPLLVERVARLFGR